MNTALWALPTTVIGVIVALIGASAGAPDVVVGIAGLAVATGGAGILAAVSE
jgi:hypothetical protein